jgi:hypothetical protein
MNSTREFQVPKRKEPTMTATTMVYLADAESTGLARDAVVANRLA